MAPPHKEGKKREKKGAAAIPSSGAGQAPGGLLRSGGQAAARGGATPSIPSLGGAAGRTGSLADILTAFRAGGWRAGAAAFMRSPAALGLLVGATAIAGGYGLVKMMAGDQGGVSPSSGQTIPVTRGGSPAPTGTQGARGDSLGLVARANEGSMGEDGADAVGDEEEIEGSDEAIEDDEGWDDEEGEDGEEEGKEDPNAMMARLAESMKGDMAGKLGGASGPGGGAGTSASLVVPSYGPMKGRTGGGGGSGNSARMKRARTMRMGRMRGGRKGGARSALGQLRNAKRHSGAATGQAGEAAYSTASSPFDGMNPGDGTSGAGLSSGEGTPEGGGGTSQSPLGGQAVNPSDNSNTNNNNSNKGPSGSGGKNVTPYQDLVDMAQMLLEWSAILLLLSFITGLIGKWWPPMAALSKGLGLMAALMGAGAALCGMMIMAQHDQFLQGGIFTAVGAVCAVLGYTAWQGNWQAAIAGFVFYKIAEPKAEEAKKELDENKVEDQ